MNFNIATEKEAKEVLKFFNYFHDSFIKSLMVVSHDEFQKDKSQICTGEFDLCLEFAHHNYKGEKTNYSQIIEVKCFDVTDFYFNLKEIKATDWTINEVKILANERKVEDAMNACLSFMISMHYYIANQWHIRTNKFFDFRTAIFREKNA